MGGIMGVSFSVKGSFKKMDSFLDAMGKAKLFANLAPYARKGVDALASATPIDSGLTAASWDYEIYSSRGSVSIVWTNSNTESGKPVAILLQYGHGTGTGGYVEGRDYINPALKPIFDQIAEDVWKVVTSA
jgi:hypothetical protein